MSPKAAFLLALKELLEKYNATISFDVGSCSDTYGLYDERIVIDHRVSKESSKEERWLEVSGWSVGSTDIQLIKE